MTITTFRRHKLFLYVIDDLYDQNDSTNTANKNEIQVPVKITKHLISKYCIPCEDEMSLISFVSPDNNQVIAKQKRKEQIPTPTLKTDESSIEPKSKPFVKPPIKSIKETKPKKVPTKVTKKKKDMVTNDIVKKQEIITKEKPNKKELSTGYLKQLKYGHSSHFSETVPKKWDPFVCKIEKRLFSKNISRYLLKVSDGDGEIYKIHLASQLFPYFDSKNAKYDENRFKQANLIRVMHYTATNIDQDKPRFIIFTDIEDLGPSSLSPTLSTVPQLQ